jgi:hypothetical protein
MYSVSAINVLVSAFLVLKINSMDPKTANFFPNYLYFNFFHLLAPVFISLAMVLLYYIKHQEILKVLIVELAELFKGF